MDNQFSRGVNRGVPDIFANFSKIEKVVRNPPVHPHWKFFVQGGEVNIFVNLFMVFKMTARIKIRQCKKTIITRLHLHIFNFFFLHCLSLIHGVILNTVILHKLKKYFDPWMNNVQGGWTGGFPTFFSIFEKWFLFYMYESNIWNTAHVINIITPLSN